MSNEEMEERKLLESITGYDDLFVISNTPAILPTFSPNEEPIKKDYRSKILDRIKGKKDTTIYMAEEGLKKISGLSLEERRQTLDSWEDLSKKLEEPRQKIFVYKAGGLPCTSLIIGKINLKDTNRYLYDVFLEYRINYYERLNDSASRKFSENKMILFYQDALPEQITDLKERIEHAECKTFMEWLRENKEKGEFIIPDPKIGIISALERELRHYQEKYEEEYHNKLGIRNRGRYFEKNSKGGLELIFAGKSYGREKTLLNTIELARQFESIDSIIFVGTAGGIPRPLPENAGDKARMDLSLYDVVISSEIVYLTYERICEGDLCKIPIGKKKIVKLNEETNLIFKYERQKASQSLRALAEDFEKWANRNQDEWVDFVRKYFKDIKGKSIQDAEFQEEISNKIYNIRPTVVVGKVFSSDHNVNFVPLRDGIAKLNDDFEDLYAFEMEGSGLAHGASAFGRNFIEIRCISDMSAGMRPKNEDKLNQTVAAIVASAALDKFLSYVWKNPPQGKRQEEP